VCIRVHPWFLSLLICSKWWTMNYLLTATCSRGIEDLVASEVRANGGTDIEIQRGAVSFQGDLACGYRCCLWTRFTSRILLRLKTFPANSPEELYDHVRSFPWDEHLTPDHTIAVDCVVNNSTITHSHYAALKVKDGVVDFFRDTTGERPSIQTDRPDFRLHLYISRNEAILSFDLAGVSLHKRGYRIHGGEAPLKETLAAAIVASSGISVNMDPGTIILDPMCGSGTLLIESALILADRAPGLERRHLGFQKWLHHDEDIWQQLLDEAITRENQALDREWPQLIGYDADSRMVGAALKNIESADFYDRIHVEKRQLARLIPCPYKQPGILITNPPYGERLSEVQEARYLYNFLGSSMETYQGWKMAVFANNPDLLDGLGHKTTGQFRFFNGPIACQLRLLDVTPQPEPHRLQLSDNTVDSDFGNRLRKNFKGLQQWTRRENIHCYRLYDRDLPEFNVAIDVYGNLLHIQEYAAPKSVEEELARVRRKFILEEIKHVFTVKRSHIFIKTRKKQKGNEQYEKKKTEGKLIQVREGACRLLVNLTDYLDTGLFLDHRPVRTMIGKYAEGKSFLNLFSYTGSATIHAAIGGATSTTSVDTSTTYLEWARKNLNNNGFETETHKTIKSDCLTWLQETTAQYDLIFMDPPTFSNTKSKWKTFDIQNDHVKLINAGMKVLTHDGLLIFSTNFRKFKLDPSISDQYEVMDISQKSIPKDFSRNQKIHYCYEIRCK
jgi:23S rRNA (guanine2445-N2)-methyltransferase / 23S rRNA (guanine2069-N7)-methyltransferase